MPKQSRKADQVAVIVKKAANGNRPAPIDISQLPEFKKAVQAIYISSPTGTMGLLHRKAGNTLILNAMEQARNGVTDNTYTITYKSFCFHIGYDSKDRETIKAVLRSLRDHPIEWNLLNEKGQERWGISSMLAEAEMVNGIIEYSFPPKAGRLLMNPEIYARLDPTMQKRFTRSYALILYESCARYRDVKRTANLEVDLWREILGATEETYATFKRFNDKVLKPAILEVNRVSDIQLTMELTTVGRKVTHIQFLIEEMQQSSLALEGTFTMNEALFARIMKLPGMTEADAKTVMLQQTEEYVIGNLEVVEAKLKSSIPPRNPRRYFLSAIQRDYRPKVPPTETPAAKTSSNKSTKSKADTGALQAAFSAHRTKRTEEILAAMESWGRESLVGKYIETVTSPELRKKYEKGGLDSSPILKKGFIAWVGSQLLTEPADTDLLEWASANGYLNFTS